MSDEHEYKNQKYYTQYNNRPRTNGSVQNMLEDLNSSEVQVLQTLSLNIKIYLFHWESNSWLSSNYMYISV